MRTRIGSLILAFILSTIFLACAPKPTENGGVDGSGGLLPYFADESFRDWVERDHQYFVRDLIHRLLIIQKNSPTDLGYDDLASRFLGNDEAELWQIVNSLSYFTADGPCPSKDNPNSDSSVDHLSKKVCFSYSAFKNLPFSHMETKLLAMTMHEIGHLRGFTEAEAVKWQLRFDGGRIGERAILVFNRNHREVVTTLHKFSDAIGSAIDALLRRDKTSRQEACEHFARAEERAQDFYSSTQLIPTYLKEQINEKFQTPILDLRYDCHTKTDRELAEIIDPLLNSIAEVQRNIENFESPFCHGNLCAFRRSAIPIDEKIISWNLKKKEFLAKKPYLVAVKGEVICSLKDLTDNREIPLSKEGSTRWETGSEVKPFLDRLSIGEQFSGDVVIELTHKGLVELIEADGFAAAEFWMKGFVAKGRHSTARFAVLDPHQEKYRKLPGESDFLAPEFELPYNVADPYLWIIKRAPSRIKEYLLDCWAK